MKTLSEYRLGINRALEALTSDPSRFERRGQLVFVRGDAIIDEKLLGPVISILTSSPGFKDKVVVGTSSSRDSELKVSSRVGDSFSGTVNLGSVLREAAEGVGGVGGGHTMAAGARIPMAAVEAFAKAVADRFPP
jgi:RecJ-like exonuclease